LPPWDIFLYLTKNLLMGATPVNTLYLDLPLPSRERTEVRGTDSHTFFHPHPDPLPSRAREIREVGF